MMQPDYMVMSLKRAGHGDDDEPTVRWEIAPGELARLSLDALIDRYAMPAFARLQQYERDRIAKQADRSCEPGSDV